MTDIPKLGELEQLLLLAVLRTGDGSNGGAVRRELKTRTGRDVGPGTLYPTLDRLETKGLLRSRLGEPTPRPGGRARRHFSLTADGLEALRQAWRERARLADGLETILDPEGR